LWESRLPPEVLRLPEELSRVDALLNDPAFFAPFAPHIHPVLGQPSMPAECYLRPVFLKFRYRLAMRTCARRSATRSPGGGSARIPLDGTVPHPTTLIKLTTRCGNKA
jgi:IS5 family transposase